MRVPATSEWEGKTRKSGCARIDEPVERPIGVRSAAAMWLRFCMVRLSLHCLSLPTREVVGHRILWPAG